MAFGSGFGVAGGTPPPKIQGSTPPHPEGVNLAYRGILADVIVYSFAHLHRALCVRYKLTPGS